MNITVWQAGLLMGLPWLAIGLLGLRHSWTEGRALMKWIWLIPALITAAILYQSTQAGGESTTVTLFQLIRDPGISLSLYIDGLSLFFGLVVSGMGILIFTYAGSYFGKKPEELKRFYRYVLFFMAAMLGTVFSGNLLFLYLWWEMTGIASFFLIGYLHEKEESRKGARMALLTTVSTGLCMLAGILIIGGTAGTFEISELIAISSNHLDNPLWTVGFILIVLGAFGKSAQFPFHYWLPNAMSAPTPVSAYLHSATMVKLGIFLIARLSPLFSSLDLWGPLLITIGFLTFLLGALFALLSHQLKAILAYSTISQLGFLVGFYGISQAGQIHWDLLHILNHVFYKGSLFMVVGVITYATGKKDIRDLGGLYRRMPLLTFITIVSAGSMAGVFLTSGFLSKEYMLKEKLSYLSDGLFLNAYPLTMVILASIFKVAFSLRLIINIFFGKESEKAVAHYKKPTLGFQLPALFLSVMTLLFGIVPSWMDKFLQLFFVTGIHDMSPYPLKLWHGIDSLAFWISMGIIACGIVVYLAAEKNEWKFAQIPSFLRFDEAFNRFVDYLPTLGKHTSRLLGVNCPKYHLPIILSVLLLWLGMPFLKWPAELALPAFQTGDLLQPILAAALLVTAGISLLIVRSWKGQLIILTAIGFLITFLFVIFRAPDPALTLILVETASILLIVLLMKKFPWLNKDTERQSSKSGIFNVVISIGAGLSVFVLTLLFTGNISPVPIGASYIEASLPLAKGTNAVNTILVDFRGFDTLMEIAVLTIAVLGIIGLILGRKKEAGDA